MLIRGCRKLLVLFSLVVLAEAGAAAPPRLEPSVARVAPGAVLQFQIIQDGKAIPAESWSVDGVAGGGAEQGAIDRQGRYRAPRHPPGRSEIHVGARAGGRTLMATVLLGRNEALYQFVRKWGEEGSEAGRFRGPHSIAWAPQGELVVVDSVSSRVARFSPEGGFLGEVGAGPGTDAGQFKAPRDARIDASRRIFVSDGDNHRVQVFDSLGQLLFGFGRKGTAPGEMLRVHALDFDREGRVFAVDVDNNRVSVFDRNGRFLSQWGREGKGPGEFYGAHSIGVDLNGEVIVSNYWAPCQKFTADGKFLFDFAHAQPPAGPVRFHSMTLDRWGNAYLAARDRQGTLVAKYNNQGDPVTTWRLSAPDHGVEWVAVSPEGTAYVAYRGKKSAGVEVYAPR